MQSSFVCGNMRDGTNIVRKKKAASTEAKVLIGPELVLPVFLIRGVLGCLHLNIRRLLIVKMFKNRGNILVQSEGRSQYHFYKKYDFNKIYKINKISRRPAGWQTGFSAV
ncbi:MAG: hypothetical protein A2V45_00290 [Candidatus Aminicenantes bacterium RBG_19FT_COMBO_58_17]|nr:MAG: hypothetical protein A2V45_00290 [Candidatus Aminicenantes bacterium RBG_19FT_COMBO_58_17]